MTLRPPSPFRGCMADDALFHGGKSSADQGEGALLIFRPLADPIASGAMTVPVIGRAGCPRILEARPVPSIAETHLGRLPC